MTGLSRRGRAYRFLTLTSSPESPSDFQRSWRRLVMRLRRRNMLREYIKVVETTEGGLVHAHVLATGDYIAQLSKLWAAIHNAPVVDIRGAAGASRRHQRRDSRRQLARYVAKYMSKDPKSRLAYSRYWAWPRLAGTWREWLRACRSRRIPFQLTLSFWTRCAQAGIPPDSHPFAHWLLAHEWERVPSWAHLGPD